MNILDLLEKQKKESLAELGYTENEMRELLNESERRFDKADKRHEAEKKAGTLPKRIEKFTDELVIKKV